MTRPRQPADTRFWRDPALPQVESRQACHSRACYRPHSHPTFSIGAVDAGRSVFTADRDTSWVLTPGSVVFVPAGRVHACNPAPGGRWSYQMLHLDAAWLQSLGVEGVDGDRDDAAAAPVHVARDPGLYARFCALNAMLFSDDAVAAKEAALISFVRDHAWATPRAVSRSRLDAVLARLRDDADCDAALPELARLAGLSPHQFIRAFRRATGMTPHAWQLNRRVNQARDRIRTGAPIAAVAHDLGFADQAHFQRVFKAFAGITPGRYR